MKSLILSAAKCRLMIVVSKNISYMRIFAGVPRGGDVNFQTTVSIHACVREFEHERTFSTCELYETKVLDVGSSKPN